MPHSLPQNPTSRREELRAQAAAEEEAGHPGVVDALELEIADLDADT